MNCFKPVDDILKSYRSFFIDIVKVRFIRQAFAVMGECYKDLFRQQQG